jgi:hypothetical protein
MLESWNAHNSDQSGEMCSRGFSIAHILRLSDIPHFAKNRSYDFQLPRIAGMTILDYLESRSFLGCAHGHKAGLADGVDCSVNVRAMSI